MARMLPRVVSAQTESKAEVRLFAKIENELGDEWTVLHSVGLASHDRKPWAELDFVVVGPSGVFCLEVKGGGIARSNSGWTTTNNRGSSALKESPFQQAGGASSALHGYLRRQVPQAAEIVVGFGVAFPDVLFQARGPDIIPQVVYDERDLKNSFVAYLQRIAKYWTDRVESVGRSTSPLDRAARNAVVSALAADFDLRPSLAVQVGHAENELIRWTERQTRVFSSIHENERIVVRGGAGTGKTSLAVEEAKRLAEKGRRVLLTCYNTRLAQSLATTAQGLSTLTVCGFHSWMHRLIVDAGRAAEIPSVEDADLFQVVYPNLAAEILLGGDPRFDVIIVDEAQDLLRESYTDVFDAAVVGGIREGSWRLFLDPNQAVFGGVGQGQLARWLSAAPAQSRLGENCRNTGPIATSAALLSNIAIEEILCRDGPAVQTQLLETPADESPTVQAIVREWVGRGIAPKDIVILTVGPTASLAGELRQRGVSVSESSGQGQVTIATLGSFKGLESSAVILCGLRNLLSSTTAMNAYVGQTRARALLAVLLPADEQDAVNSRAEEFGRMLVGN